MPLLCLQLRKCVVLTFNLQKKELPKIWCTFLFIHLWSDIVVKKLGQLLTSSSSSKIAFSCDKNDTRLLAALLIFKEDHRHRSSSLASIKGISIDFILYSFCFFFCFSLLFLYSHITFKFYIIIILLMLLLSTST